MSQDRRLTDRELSHGRLSQEKVDVELAQLPDLAGDVAESDTDAGQFADELKAEKVARDEQIERVLAEPKLPPAPPEPVQLIAEFEDL